MCTSEHSCTNSCLLEKSYIHPFIFIAPLSFYIDFIVLRVDLVIRDLNNDWFLQRMHGRLQRVDFARDMFVWWEGGVIFPSEWGGCHLTCDCVLFPEELAILPHEVTIYTTKNSLKQNNSKRINFSLLSKGQQSVTFLFH